MKKEVQKARWVRQVALADDYVPGWVALMDIAPVDRNPIGECAEFFLPVTLHTLGSGLIGFQTPSAGDCNSDRSTSDHCASLPVQGKPRRDTGEHVHPACWTEVFNADSIEYFFERTRQKVTEVPVPSAAVRTNLRSRASGSPR